MMKVVLFVLLATTVAFAQPRRMMHDRPMGQRMMHEAVVEKLKLTDDQEKQFGKLHAELEKKQIALRSKVQTLRVELRELFNEDKPDRGKIESKIGEISKLQNEMKLNHVGLWFDVSKILTPEQQEIWKERPLGGPGPGNSMHRPGRGMRMHGRGMGMGMDDCPGCPCPMMELDDEDVD